MIIDFQFYLLPETDVWDIKPKDSLEVISYLKSIGVENIFCAPTIRSEFAQNTREYLQQQFNSFQDLYGNEIEMKLAAKYRMDEEYLNHLTNNDLLTVGGNYLLADASPITKPDNLWEMIDATVAKGYNPILIQPERYEYCHMEDFVQLKEHGCKLMLNLYSLAGYNGQAALHYSIMLLQKEMYSYVTSGIEDKKSMRYTEGFEVGDRGMKKKLEKLYENNRLLWKSSI